MDACGWCGDAPWTFSCATCDPRRTKFVCDTCAKRWHARGASRAHVLRNRAGEAKEFIVWLHHALVQAAAAAEKAASAAAKDGDADAPTTLDSGANAKDASSAAGNTSAQGGASAATSQPPLADPARPLSASSTETVEERQVDRPTEQQGVAALSSGEDTDEFASLSGDEASARVNGDRSATGANGTAADPLASESTDEEKLVPLNELLAQLPSDAPHLIDMLSEYIHAAIRVQDAITCVRYSKCTDPVCQRTVEIFRHNVRNEPPCDVECRLGLEIHQHLRSCSAPGCPFCIRVQLRKALNTIRAIESLIARQKRTMKQLLQLRRDDGASDDVDAKFNFCRTQVRDYERKRLLLIEDVEAMNSIVLDKRLPIFNFPKPSWHIDSVPLIKTERVQTPPRSTAAEVSEQHGQANAQASSDAVAASALEPTATTTPAAPASTASSPTTLASIDNDVPAAESVDADSTDLELPELGGDYIRTLLDRKRADPRIQQAFDESMTLAFAVVEASFCSPAKVQRCLFNCQRILDHLQHHLDLSVCAETMCTTIEYHFLHLSLCSEAGESNDCEYCLRVKEREYMRALDIMESDQREAEAKAQAVRREMEASLANDTREEHETTVSILGDELEQMKEYIQDTAAKVTATRTSLTGTRTQLQRFRSEAETWHAMQPLPVHFSKLAKKSDAKRRKA